MSTPTEIGPYRVIRPIAEGGMGGVYEVAEARTGEHMALKMLNASGTALKRFNREFEAMIRVNHPNIVRVYNYGLFKSRPWFTMELIDGTPVQAHVKGVGRPSASVRVQEVLRCAIDLLSALQHIHERGLVHRDLKSANVLVLPDGRLKLVDFGTARVADAIDAITKEGEFVGTFAYCSPEQITGKPLDQRSDLYSFGVLLYRMATAKKPFTGETPQELAREHLSIVPRPPREIVPSLPKELSDVVLRLLEKRADDRFATAEEVSEALKPLVDPAYAPKSIQVATDRLVGREEETQALRRFVDAAEPASFALVVGTGGSGRQSVLQAAEAYCRTQQMRSFPCFFQRDADELDAIGTMLRAICASFGEDSRVEALEQVVTRIESVATDHGKPASVRADVLAVEGAKLLAARAHRDGKPILLVLHGLHLAGASAFGVLVGLRDALKRSQPSVLFAADCVETADDPDSLARKRLPDALRLCLSPLNAHQVALLVGSMLNRRPPPLPVARRILQASGGLPVYIEEVVQGLVEDGLLAVAGADVNRIQWSKKTLQARIPPGANRRVLAALSQLPSDRRRLLEALALAGGDMELLALAKALERNPEELALAVDDVCSRGWVTRYEAEGTIWLKWRQLIVEPVILDHLRPTRRRVIERLLAVGVSDRRPFSKQIELLGRTGRVDDAVERARVWCREQLELDRPITVSEVLEPLLLRLDSADRTAVFDKARLHLLYVQALLLCRPQDPAIERSLALAAESGDQKDPDFVGELEWVRAVLLQGSADYAAACDQLERAWTSVASETRPSPVAGRVAWDLGWLLTFRGKLEDAGRWFGRARQEADRLRDRKGAARADAGAAAVLLANGGLLEAEAMAKGAMDECDSQGDLRGLSMALPIWVEALRMQGRWSDALDRLAMELPRMRQAETPTLYVRTLVAAAWCEVELQRLGRAQEHVDELSSFLRGDEQLHLRLETEIVSAQICLASGELFDAHARLTQLAAEAKRAGLPVLAALATAEIGEASWLMGDARRGDRAFDAAVADLTAIRHRPALLATCQARARVSAERRNPDELFAPVEDLLAAQPVHVAHVQLMLAHARHARHRGERGLELYKEARSALEAIAEGLNTTDKAAIRHHPMSRHLRIGLTPR